MKVSVQQFLDFLSRAGAVIVDGGPLLGNWTTAPITGEPGNEVVHFAWEDEDYTYNYKLTEESILNGRFNEDNSFICSDTIEDDTEIRFYSLTPLGLPL